MRLDPAVTAGGPAAAALHQALAARQLQDLQDGTPGTCFAEPQDAFDLDGAYAVQAEVAQLRCAAGDRIIGYKVGCTGPGVVAQFGMAGPIRGMLLASGLHRSGAVLPARAFANLAIEGEMAMRIGADGTPSAVFPVIELHHFVFRGARKTLVELVANNGLNAGVVLPDEENSAWAPRRTWAARLTLWINGRLADAGCLWPLPGGPEASLEWLRANLHGHGLDLRPGDLVLAGTPLGLLPVQATDQVRVCLDGVPAVECNIV
jgi:2-keto-4-pentenoate hydratase